MSVQGIPQKAQQQQIIITSGQNQQPAVNGSVFNERGTTGYENSGEQLSYNYSNETSEKIYDRFIEDMLEQFQYYGLTKEKLINLCDQLGYSREKCISLSRDELNYALTHLPGIFDNIYGMNVDAEQRSKDVIALSKYNDLESLKKYLCHNGDRSFKKIISTLAEDKNLEVPDGLREKWKNFKSINDLSFDELKAIIMILIRQEAELEKNGAKSKGKEKKLSISAEQLVSYLFLNMPEDVFKANSALCTELYGAIKQVDEDKMPPGLCLLMIDKLKDSSDQLRDFLSQEKIGDIFGSFNDETRIQVFFNNAQRIIDSGKAEDKSVLANNVSEYLSAMLSRFNKINAKKDRTPEDEAFLNAYHENYNRLERLYAVATGYAFANADDQHVEELVQAPMSDDFRNLAYKYTYENSLDPELGLDAVKITERLDKFTQNAYSQILQDMGYEIPTADNIDALREQAKNGTLLGSGNSESEDGIGYAQHSQNAVSMAAEKAEVLASYITPAPAQETFTIEGKAEEPAGKIDIQPAKPVNVTNLGLFNGNELEKLINEKLIKFTDAVKQYSSKLSQSGKDFVVDKIKRKSKGEQAYALNKTSNNAKFDIMKKADLMDEDLNVKFDTVHEQLRERYTA